MVEEGHKAILVQLGEVKTLTPLSPGLHFKWPFIDKVVLIDSRTLDIESDSSEIIASDQKRIVVNYYAKYKIIDPILFYKSARNETILENRLRSIVESQVREEVGRVPLTALLTEARSSIMGNIKHQSDLQSKSFGVSIIDVRVKRTDLPEENSEAIFKRMQTEREKEAREIRATGFEEAQYVRSLADKERVMLLADANKKANILKAEGDSLSASTLNDAFSKDPEFFEFYRSLQSYKSSFNTNNTKMVISIDHDYFNKFLKDEKK